jgi:hypothetical protein
MLEDRSGDLDHIVRQSQEHRAGGGGIGRKARGECRTLRNVGRIDEPQRKLRIVAFVFRRVRPPLQIEIGQYPQQGRAHVDPVAMTEIEQVLETSKRRRRFRHGNCAFAATLGIRNNL